MTKSWMRLGLLTVGLGIVATDLLASFSAIKAPYAWTDLQNLMFFGLQRLTYVTAIFMILFTFLFGGLPMGKAFLTRPVWLVLGKVVFEACLVCPCII